MAVKVWGTADLRGFPTPKDDNGQGFPFALSWAVPMDPHVMAGIQKAPNRAYAEEYTVVNTRVNETGAGLAAEIKKRHLPLEQGRLA